MNPDHEKLKQAHFDLRRKLTKANAEIEEMSAKHWTLVDSNTRLRREVQAVTDKATRYDEIIHSRLAASIEMGNLWQS